ncbi:MAG: ABC transporter ATP-binding protein [Bacillota bacterium]
MKKYGKYIKPYWIFFVLSPLLMIVEVGCDVMLPTLSANIINVGVANSDGGEIVKIMFEMLFFVLLAIASGTGASFCAARASAYFARDLRSDLFKKIQEFSFKNIDKFSTGSLVTRLTNDITQLQNFVVMCLRMMFRAPGMLLGAIIMVYLISPTVSTVYICIVPVLALIIFLVLYFSYSKFGLLQVRIDALNTKVREILTNIRVIKALTREKHEEDSFKEVNSELKNTGLKAYRITVLQLPLMTIVVNFATIFILWLSSQLLDVGEIAIGDVSAFITYLTQILASVNMIAMVFLQSSRAIVSSHRITEVMETNVDIKDDGAKCPERKVGSGDIEFKNVNFRYYLNSNEDVLSDISVKIKSGETVGIIGSTGSGKTSFVNLIPRLYDVTSGSLLVDGVDVRDYSLENLRDGVAVVLQNNMLFSGTIEENLRWGDENASMEEIEEVSEWSAAAEFVSDKQFGYQSQLEQGGVNLSGGQKQRLCIARALLKKPKILILDDSTSAVDTATERKITHHLKNELSGATKIIIAQRISSVCDADKIIVLDDGKIESVGTHEQLLESSVTYREINDSQTGKGVK